MLGNCFDQHRLTLGVGDTHAPHVTIKMTGLNELGQSCLLKSLPISTTRCTQSMESAAIKELSYRTRSFTVKPWSVTFMAVGST